MTWRCPVTACAGATAPSTTTITTRVTTCCTRAEPSAAAHNGIWLAEELDKLVWGEVRRHLEHPALIREGHTRLQAQSTSLDGDGLADEVRALEKQLAELDREEHRLLDAYQAGLIDLDQLRQRQARLRQRRSQNPEQLGCSPRESEDCAEPRPQGVLQVARESAKVGSGTCAGVQFIRGDVSKPAREGDGCPHR